ncbi:MAG TPA: tol-pal system protein YbgF [Methylovirgula sp.]|nr:tol-pal system protein YbgF [Methylovirgula sp.]
MISLNKRVAALIAAGTMAFVWAFVCALSSQVLAQDYGAPPAADVGAAPDAGGGAPDATSGSSDAASLLLRVEKLEDQVRQMSGQMEQMQYDNKQLQDQLHKFQQDVDYRFQESGRGRVRHEDSGAASSPYVPPAANAAPPAALHDDAFDPRANPSAPGAPHELGATGAIGATHSHGDAFDPSADPNAPGAPHPLGSPDSASKPLATNEDSDAPLNLSGSNFHTAAPDPTPAMVGAVPANVGGTVLASAEVNPTRQEFDAALGYFRQKDYDNAEKGFSAFLEKNPKSRWTSDALFYLGETYYQRGRQREAAEQYLKISTNYANSARAPEAMLRLGESLQALGAKEQACATFSEVPRKYPNASAAIKAGAEREAKRAQC